MNLDQLKGNWKQLKGDLKSEFGKLTDDEIMQAEGEATVLLGKIQEKYGVTKEQAEEKLDDFLARH
ncbi:CsbD family protein [Arenicella chitinivorans]|uniref:CsbD family protein n=1 Tax=Arenicella chitinivorans TaxID=1329800 RepID=A0A918RY74_9GAMM|nr:CsbD family protein [Arenicella chitinivorans]GHA13264.1 CsbD family protein [Arenicella chitinivorans]